MSGNKKEEALIHVQGLGKSFGDAYENFKV